MSTRGSIGVLANGILKLTYNHSDSYPESLGVALAEQLTDLLSRHDQTSLKALADCISVVDPDSKPTEAQKQKLAALADLNVSERSLDDWYCLTRNLQGELALVLEKVGIMCDGSDFPKDSLFCEWAYVANFDDMTLEVFKGFQTKQHSKGRFADPTCTEEYKPVKLVKTFKLDALLKPLMAKWIKTKIVTG